MMCHGGRLSLLSSQRCVGSTMYSYVTIDSCVGLPTPNRDKFSRERSTAATEDTMSAPCKIRTHELRHEFRIDTDENDHSRIISGCNATKNKSIAAEASDIHGANHEARHMRWSALGHAPLVSTRDPNDPRCRAQTCSDRIHTTTGMHAHVPTQGKE